MVDMAAARAADTVVGTLTAAVMAGDTDTVVGTLTVMAGIAMVTEDIAMGMAAIAVGMAGIGMVTEAIAVGATITAATGLGVYF